MINMLRNDKQHLDSVTDETVFRFSLLISSSARVLMYFFFAFLFVCFYVNSELVKINLFVYFYYLFAFFHIPSLHHLFITTDSSLLEDDQKLLSGQK